MTWAVRPQAAHWPWLAGSARKHLLQTGSPAAVRLATWAGWRQRLQASSRARTQQRVAAARRAEPVAQRHRLAAGRAGRGHHAGRAGGQ